MSALPACLVYLRSVFGWIAEAEHHGWTSVAVDTAHHRDTLRALRNPPLWGVVHPWLPDSHCTLAALATDASGSGLGAVLTTLGHGAPRRLEVAFPRAGPGTAEAKPYIHVAEAHSLLMGLQQFAPLLERRRVLLLTDNEAVRQAVLVRGSRDPALNEVAPPNIYLINIHTT